MYGHNGQAIEFAGVDGEYVDAGSDSSLDNLRAFTWSAWVYADELTDYATIMHKGGSWDKWFFLYEDGRIRGYVQTDGTDASSCSVAGVIGTGQWHHVAMTYDGFGDRNIRIYVDGAEVTYRRQQAATGSERSDANYNLEIGDLAADSNVSFNGRMDEVRVHSAALTATRVATLSQ